MDDDCIADDGNDPDYMDTDASDSDDDGIDLEVTDAEVLDLAGRKGAFLCGYESCRAGLSMGTTAILRRNQPLN